jgi:hypothetical protein
MEWRFSIKEKSQLGCMRQDLNKLSPLTHVITKSQLRLSMPLLYNISSLLQDYTVSEPRSTFLLSSLRVNILRLLTCFHYIEGTRHHI